MMRDMPRISEASAADIARGSRFQPSAKVANISFFCNRTYRITAVATPQDGRQARPATSRSRSPVVDEGYGEARSWHRYRNEHEFRSQEGNTPKASTVAMPRAAMAITPGFARYRTQ